MDAAVGSSGHWRRAQGHLWQGLSGLCHLKTESPWLQAATLLFVRVLTGAAQSASEGSGTVKSRYQGEPGCIVQHQHLFTEFKRDGTSGRVFFKWYGHRTFLRGVQ